MIRNTTAAPFYFSFMLVPDIGIEPMTYRLSSDYSTAELIRCNLFWCRLLESNQLPGIFSPLQ